MGTAEFEENFLVLMLLNVASDPDKRKEYEISRATKRAIRLDATGMPMEVTRPFDPDTATPEEFDAWLRSMNVPD